jgi:polar amino acid transport system permease protein
VTQVREVSAVELERRAFRRRRSTRSVAIAVGSSLVVAVAVWVFVVNTKGWAAAQQTFFDPAEAAKTFPAVLAGLWVNVYVLFFAAIGVAICATLLAVIRTLRGPVFAPLRFLAAAYTDLFRGVPMIVLIYLVGFGIPALGVLPLIDPRILGGVALVIGYSAYVAEVLRAGIESVHPSQRLAARSLGLSYGQTLRLIVLPQGVRRVVPALMNDFVSMQKDVGLISILGVVDAISAANIQKAISYNYTAFVIAGLLFILLSLPFVQLTNHLERRALARQQQGSVV